MRHHVDVGAEVVDPEGRREAGRAGGGQHVVRAGHVVAHAGRGVGAQEHRTGATHQREQRLGSFHQQLEVLGRHHVGDRQRLRRDRRRGTTYPPVPRVASRSARRGDAATSRSTSASMASAASGDHVTSQARPSGPCSAWTTTSMAAHATGVASSATTTTSEGPAKAEGTPTIPDTWRLASAT